MPRFNYQARNKLGERLDGMMLAENERQLALTLRAMDLYLINAQPERAPSLLSMTLTLPRRVGRRELIDFTVHLAAAIGAGIPILQAFEDLESQTANGKLKRAIRVIREDLSGGSSLFAALGRHPTIFSEVYTNIVQVGEISGSLVQVLQRLNSYLEWQDSLASEIKRATTYPVVVLTAVLGLIALLLGFVFPKILPVLEGLKVPLPFITRAVIAAGNFIRYGWYWMLLGAASLIVLIRLLKTIEGGRLIIDAAKLRAPVLGDFVEKICLSRFAHHFRTLLTSGIDITRALTISERVVGNAVLAQAIGEAREKVIQGGSLWRSLQETGAFPAMFVRMIFVGETTGSLDTRMEGVTDFYDQQIPNAVKRLFSIIEPILIGVLAIMVLIIALSIFLPLYNMGGIGRR